MKVKKLSRENFLILIAGITAILLVSVTFVDGADAQCENIKQGIIIHDVYVAITESTPFQLLWSFQFLKSNLLAPPSPHGSINQNSEISAEISQETQAQLVKDINSSKCDNWKNLRYIILVLAMIGQISIMITSFKTKSDSNTLN